MSETLLDLQRRTAEDLVKILFEVTVYPSCVTVLEFERIVEIFLTFCPPNELKLFRISELPAWSQLKEPALTRCGREALSKGTPMPFFEPVRKRIGEDRAFVARLWDGRGIDDPAGSWSLTVVCEKYLNAGLHSYARVLLPLQTDPRTLVALARYFADEIDLRSGHGGPVFTFDPVLPYSAFTRIYPYSRRYLGIDLDMLDMCLGHMQNRLKSPCWVNLIGHEFALSNGLPPPPDAVFRKRRIHTFRQKFASVHIVRDAPASLDVNRRAEGFSAYRVYGEYVADFILSEFDTGTLDGEGFLSGPAATDEWLHRFSGGSIRMPEFAEA